MTKNQRLDAALDHVFQCDDLECIISVREYLKRLLRDLWEQKEGFSGKRPFGNSDWDHQLFTGLAIGGFIKAKFDENGYLDNFDERGANRFVVDLIERMASKG